MDYRKSYLLPLLATLVFLGVGVQVGQACPGTPSTHYDGTAAGVSLPGGALQFSAEYAQLAGFDCFETFNAWFPGYITSSGSVSPGKVVVNMAYATAGTATFYNVVVPTAGNYTLTFRYGFVFGVFPQYTDRPEGVSVNGVVISNNLDFFITYSFDTAYSTSSLTVPLNAGKNTVQMFNVTDHGISRYDTMTVSSPSDTTCVSAPAAPGGLAATAVSSTRVNLTWNASAGAANCTVTGYNVFRGTSSGFIPQSSSQIATGVTTTSFTDTNAAASTTYYYYVMALDSAATSLVSNEASVKTPSSSSTCTAAPGAPSGLAATSVSSSQINLSWTASTIPSGCTLGNYNVYRGTTSGFTPSSTNQIASVTTISYSDTSGACATTYYYLVKAVDSAGTSGASNQASATTSACPTGGGGVQINSGGPAVSPFVADVDFSGGTTINHANTIDLSGVTNPAPMAVYQTARVNTFSYTIPGFTAGSSHTVRLHFAETYFSSAGSRVFNVSINGTQVLTNFDVFVAAGNAKNKAVIEQFTENANSSGQYVLQFTTVTNSALVSGIEIQ